MNLKNVLQVIAASFALFTIGGAVVTILTGSLIPVMKCSALTAIALLLAGDP